MVDDCLCGARDQNDRDVCATVRRDVGLRVRGGVT